MPQLPTFTIDDQAKWDRIYAAFNGSATEYKAWLKEALVLEVRDREARALMQQAQEQIQVTNDELDGYLDTGVTGA